MKAKGIIFTFSLIFSLILEGQILSDKIHDILTKDSIEYDNIEVNIYRLGKVNSKNENYHLIRVFKTRMIILSFYYIYDQEKNALYPIKSRKLPHHNIIDKFAIFYEDKLVVGWNGICNEFIEEFDLKGNQIVSREGIIPRNQRTNRYDKENNVVVWITEDSDKEIGLTYKIWIYNLKKGRLTCLAEVKRELDASPILCSNYLPMIQIERKKRRVKMKKYHSGNDSKSISEIENKQQKIYAKSTFEENNEEFIFEY
jgi:hypothetical protein